MVVVEVILYIDMCIFVGFCMMCGRFPAVLASCVSWMLVVIDVFFFQAEDGIRDLVRSRGLGDVYKRQVLPVLHDILQN